MHDIARKPSRLRTSITAISVAGAMVLTCAGTAVDASAQPGNKTAAVSQQATPAARSAVALPSYILYNYHGTGFHNSVWHSFPAGFMMHVSTDCASNQDFYWDAYSSTIGRHWWSDIQWGHGYHTVAQPSAIGQQLRFSFQPDNGCPYHVWVTAPRLVYNYIMRASISHLTYHSSSNHPWPANSITYITAECALVSSSGRVAGSNVKVGVTWSTYTNKWEESPSWLNPNWYNTSRTSSRHFFTYKYARSALSGWYYDSYSNCSYTHVWVKIPR